MTKNGLMRLHFLDLIFFDRENELFDAVNLFQVNIHFLFPLKA